MRYSYEKNCTKEFLKLVGVSASIPILQSLPIASASATDLSDYPLLKDGIFDFENTDITQYVDDVQEVFGSEKDMIEEMDTSQSGGVVGTPVIINHQNTSTYGKHISGTVGVGTQSNSSNMETIQIFVAYAHSTVSVTFSADVALQWKQVGMSINFTPQKKTTIIARGNATFKYNGQGYQTAGTV